MSVDIHMELFLGFNLKPGSVNNPCSSFSRNSINCFKMSVPQPGNF